MHLFVATVVGAALQQSAAAADQVAWYLGDVRMSTPAGQMIGTSLSLVKRTVQPEQERIVEVVASIEAGKPVREYTTTFEVTGTRFKMKDAEGTFTGEGELTGPAWAWTGWTYEAVFNGARQGRLKGDDTLGPDGIRVKKSFAGPDGTVRVLFVEDLRPIAQAAYELLRRKLLSDQK